MDQKKKIIELAKETGVIRPREVESMGVPVEYLLRLCRSGELEKVGHGLYAIPGTLTSEFSSLAEISKKSPESVICLISALEFHHLTTQISPTVWIAIERDSWPPKLDYPPLEIVHVSGKAFEYGVEEYTVNKVPVKVYSPAKTVADCFKFRSKVGLDVALEALQETWKNNKATADELWKAAKVCRMSNVMKPYMEAIIT